MTQTPCSRRSAFLALAALAFMLLAPAGAAAPHHGTHNSHPQQVRDSSEARGGDSAAGSRSAAADAAGIDWNQYDNLALEWLRAYLRVNTSNPPGHEMRAVQFWQKLFEAEGIETHIFAYAPQRGNIVAILHADGSARPLVLLNHLDVVTTIPERWRVPPFAGLVRDGVLYGRGAEDMKNEAVAQAITLVALKREHVPLKRDVIFLGTADEEVGGTGSEFMIAHQRAQLRHAEYLITEGGENLRGDNGVVQRVGISVMAKAPYWLQLTAHGRSGHGSIPLADSAPNRLVRALARVVAWKTPITLMPPIEEFFHGMAPAQPEPQRGQFAHIRESLKDPKFVDWISGQEDYNYLLRDTVVLTGLEGSPQTNVIPSQASARLDIRLLPITDRHEFRKSLEKVIDDSNIDIRELGQYRPPNSSPTSSPLYKAIVAAAQRAYPKAVVVPSMSSGYNESQMYRQLGIECYGFTPYGVTEAESASEHSDNERIAVDELKQGQRVLFEAVRSVVARDGGGGD